MSLTPEEKKIGQENYHEAMGAMEKGDPAAVLRGAKPGSG